MKLNPGDVIRVFMWHGVVNDVFTSTSGRTVVEIYCVKHAIKRQPPELFVLDSIEWKFATLHDLMMEHGQHQKRIESKMDKILALYSRQMSQQVTGG